MSASRSKTGNLADNSAESAVEEPQKGETSLENLMQNVDSNDLICITRTAPWSHAGYLGTIAYNPAMDLLEELSNEYGGKNYKIQIKKRANNGSYIYAKGCAYVTIAGPPKTPRQPGDAPPTALAAVAPSPFPYAAPASDMQARLLDILTEKLKTPGENLTEVVNSIIAAVHTPQQGNQLEQLLATVETGRKLARAFGTNDASPRQNPRDDEDEEPKEEDPMDKLIKMGMMMIMSQFMGQKPPQAVQAPLGNPQPHQGPPGPPPPGYAWAHHPQYGFVLAPASMSDTDRSGRQFGYASKCGAPVFRDATGYMRYEESGTQVPPIDRPDRWEKRPNPTSNAQAKQEVVNVPPLEARARREGETLHVNADGSLKEPWTSMPKSEPPEGMTWNADLGRFESIVPDSPRGGTIEGGGESLENGNGTKDEPEECICNEPGDNEECPVCYHDVTLDEASVDDIADVIEGMDDEEKAELFAKLAPKFGLDPAMLGGGK